MINSFEKFLQTKYANATFKSLLGGYTNGVFLIENITPPLVIKISQLSTIDSHVEYVCLNMLSNFKWIPKIKENFKLKGKNILSMEYITGINAQSYLDNNDIYTSKKIYKELGEQLAQIHSIKISNLSNSLPLFKLTNIDISKVKKLIPETFNDIQKYLSIEEDDNYVLTHGDFGCHNSILSNNLLYIIDWEWAGLGNPLLDISWIMWLLKFHYPSLSNILFQTFINSYNKNSSQSIHFSKIKAYVIFKIISIINKIPTNDTDSLNEWIKRLLWTLEADFKFI